MADVTRGNIIGGSAGGVFLGLLNGAVSTGDPVGKNATGCAYNAVFSWRNCFQMIRITATSVAAQMINRVPVRNWAFVYFVGKAVA